jgi:hypothetical protein
MHWLRAALGQVNDGKPTVCQTNAAIVREPCSCAIRAASTHVVANAVNHPRIDRIDSGSEVKRAGYAAHKRTIAMNFGAFTAAKPRSNCEDVARPRFRAIATHRSMHNDRRD